MYKIALKLKRKIQLAYQKGGFWLIFFKAIIAFFRKSREVFVSFYFMALPSRYFYFKGKKFFYLRHVYNKTYQNERTVEVPIILETIKQAGSGRILEVGNVIKNYYPKLSHDVLDKYDDGEMIIKEDIESFKPKEKYDLIVSISTMEHVGWDEEPREPEKIINAFINIKKNCLKKGGEFIFTAPLGYNRALDDFLRARKLSFTEQYFLKRISSDNRWAEIGYDEVKEAIYGYPFSNANAIMVGIERKE